MQKSFLSSRIRIHLRNEEEVEFEKRGSQMIGFVPAMGA